MASFRDFGNDLYSGQRSIEFVGRRKTWYLVGVVVVLLAIIAPILRGGFSFGIEFTGGSEFRIDGVSSQGEAVATEVVDELFPGADSVVTIVGVDSIRVQTEQLEDVESEELRLALADAYGVQGGEVASSFIGPNWGVDVTNQAIQGLVVFLILVSLLMAVYFRSWKMSVAALAALAHDLIITVGIYAATLCMTLWLCLTRLERIPKTLSSVKRLPSQSRSIWR
jgi:preprotein translocase subunit SecF